MNNPYTTYSECVLSAHKTSYFYPTASVQSVAKMAAKPIDAAYILSGEATSVASIASEGKRNSVLEPYLGTRLHIYILQVYGLLLHNVLVT